MSNFATTYSYTVNGGAPITGQSTATINLTSLSIGNQVIIVTDETTGCTDTFSVTVSEPNVLTLVEATNTNANCNFGTQVSVTASEGTPNYTYAFVEDGTFVKLREMSLYYTLDAKALGNIGNFIDTVKLGFIGRNLLTITDYSGFDPDITNQPESSRANLTSRDTDGIGSDANTPGGDPNVFKVDNFPYPSTKTYSFSVQLTF